MPQPQHDIIVVGASQGGVAALRVLVAGLPSDLSAAVFIVLHTPPTWHSLLSSILDRAGGMRVSEAVDGEIIRRGHVYVAKPDHHLLLGPERIALGRGPRENRSRPAIDALFRSAAVAYGPRVIGVVLTGRLDDGTAGLWAIKRAGGIAVIQDPKSAEAAEMPGNAMHAVDIDHCLPLGELPALLTGLVASPAAPPAAVAPDLIGKPILGLTFTCPDCQGPLSQVRAEDERMVRFRCHVGHAYSVMSLLAAQAEAREELLWTVVRTLEDECVLTGSALELAESETQREAMRVQAAANQQLALRIRDQLALMPGPLAMELPSVVAAGALTADEDRVPARAMDTKA